MSSAIHSAFVIIGGSVKERMLISQKLKTKNIPSSSILTIKTDRAILWFTHKRSEDVYLDIDQVEELIKENKGITYKRDCLDIDSINNYAFIVL